MIRFLHSADWQLGMTRHFLSEEAQGRFTQDRIDAIRRMGALAREHGAQLVVVGGDVFESNQVGRPTVVRALNAMGEIPVPVFLLPGNHDPLDAGSVYRSATFRERKPPNVFVIEGPEPLAVPGVPDAEVVGAPWRSKRPLGDLVAELCAGLAPCTRGVRIAVGHGAVDGLSPDPDAPALVRLEAAERALREGRIHYLALGDRHSATRVGESGAIWYSGAPVATDFDEVRAGFVLLVELEAGAPPRVQELAVGGWRFLDRRFELGSEEDLAELARWLGACPERERSIVRLALVGTLGIAAKARLDALLADYEDHFAALQIWERETQLVVLPEAADAERLGLAGYAREAWQELEAQARAGGPDAGRALDAMALLYRVAQEGAA